MFTGCGLNTFLFYLLALAADKSCDANPTDRCLNGGTCLTRSDGLKKYCGCAPGYRGLYCEEQKPSCPQPTELIDLLNTIEGNHSYLINSFYEGSVLTIFRSLGSRPSYWLSTCDGSTWSNTSITILQHSTTRPTSTTSRPNVISARRSDNSTLPPIFEWNDTVATIVISATVVIMQVLNPLIVWCIVHCVSSARAKKVEQEEEDELQNLQRTYETSLEVFRQNHPGLEEEFVSTVASQLNRIHDDYQRHLTEITERRETIIHRSKGRAKFCRIFSLYAYVTFWIYLLYVILHSTTRLFGGTVFFVLFIISAILVFVTYLIVIFEYKSASEIQYIDNLSPSVFAVQRIEAIRATQPSILFRCQSYHYEEKTRKVTYPDAKGNLKTTEMTYQDKVVTNLILEPVSFQYWKDTSTSKLAGINDKGITKIKMTLSVEPGDEETAAAIAEQYYAFQNARRNLDVFVDFSMEKQVPGFEKRLAAYTNNRVKPTWVSSVFYTVATLLCLSWPYRWAFNSITSKTEFAVSKLVYIRRQEQDSGVNSLAATTESTYAVRIRTDQTPPTCTTPERIYMNPAFNAPNKSVPSG